MDKKMKHESTKTLEEEFRAFQVEWRKFLTNDFHHLTADVAGIRKDVNTSIGHVVSLVKDQKGTEKSIQVIDQNIRELLKRVK